MPSSSLDRGSIVSAPYRRYRHPATAAGGPHDLICRFIIDPATTEGFLTRARRALGLLTTQQGCLGGQLGRSPDDVTRCYEVLATAQGGAVTDHGSLLAPDAERGFGSGAR